MATMSQELIVVIHIVGEIMKIKISCCWTCQIASLAEGMNVGLVSLSVKIGAGSAGPQIVVNINTERGSSRARISCDV